SYYANSFPHAMHAEYEKKWHAENDPKIGQEPMVEAVSYRGPDFDDMKPHLWNFFQAVRSRKPVVEDAVFGHHAALACHMANESYFRKSAVACGGPDRAGRVRGIRRSRGASGATRPLAPNALRGLVPSHGALAEV